MFDKNLSRTLIIIFSVLFFGGLTSAAYLALTYRHIDQAVSLSSPPLSFVSQPLHEGLTFRVALANMISPVKGYKLYQDLADLLAHEYGLPLELVTGEDYAEVDEMLHESKVDLAFVCTGGFVSASEAMEVIAAPTIQGKPEIEALIIVPAESEARSLTDLRGKRFLFVDPESNTGYWYVEKKLAGLGETPDRFFGSVSFTGSHDHSIVAVSQRMVEGASVSSMVYNLMIESDRLLSRRVRVIETSPPFLSPPVVVRKTMPMSQRNRLTHVLFHLADTEQGKAILRSIGADGFVPARNQDYQTLVPPEGPP